MKKPTKSSSKKEAKKITKEAIENVSVTVFEPKSDENTFTGASLNIETEAGHIYIKGFARWSEKNENWFFSGPSHKGKKDGKESYINDVFGDKAVIESINNAVNAAMEEM